MYVFAASVFSWPLILHLHSSVGAINAADAAGDPALNLWALGWDLQALTAHPSWLLTGRVFEANIYFPAAHTLAYSDHLLLQAIALWPLYAITHDLVFCYNVLLLASLAGSALAMHVFMRRLAGSERAAYVAGLIYGFAPYHFTHITHIQLQALYFLPLSLLFLHRLFEAERRADVIALGLVVGLQAVSSVYYAVIGGLGLAVVGAAFALLTGRILDWALVRRALTAAAIALLVATPWSIAYLRVQRDALAGRNLYEAAQGSAVPASYLQAPPANLLYGHTGWLRPSPTSRLNRKEGAEQALFPGFCALLLALLGSMAAPRGLKRVAVVYLILAIAGFVLSLGPDGIRPLYAALHRMLPGMAANRTPARFSVLIVCAIAVLAALAARTLEIKLPRRGQVAWVAILAVISVEYINWTPAFPPAPVLTSNAGRWLRDRPGTGAVICLPMDVLASNTACMLQSLEHGRAVVNGQSGVRPPFLEALVDVAGRVPAPDALLALHDLGVEYIVTERPLAIEDGEGGALVERVAFSDQHVYELLWSPAIESKLMEVSEVPPPEPGPPSFSVGELATYQVTWTNGPVSLPAGEATIAVVAPQEAERFRFVVSAKTAPWVSRFYDADALLESAANQRLLPLTYREAITEGKRRINRQLSFDSVRREVRIVAGSTSITLPLSREARDPITALFYVRTLPMTSGTRVTLPVSDNGRRLTLDVVVDRMEAVVVAGKDWPAWRVEPRVGDPLGANRFAITAWVSADARQIPLRVDVGARFGSVRMELTGYREQ